MYSLVQDETECKSILGTLTYTERKVYGFSTKVVDMVMPVGMFGHVEYKLEIKATPHNSIDNEPRIFTLDTRFKETNNLHKTLSVIHRNLYLKDKFPPFAKTQYFGTTTPETIEERKTHIENFLQFILNNETLCKSKAFQAFIEPSKVLKATQEGANNEPESAERSLLAEATLPAQNDAVKNSSTDELMTLEKFSEGKEDEERPKDGVL